MVITRRLALFVVFCITAVPACAQEREAIRAMTALVNGDSVDIEDTLAFAEARARYECVDLIGVRGTVSRDDANVVDITLAATGTLRIGHRQAEFPPFWRVRLRGNDVVAVTSPERDVAAKIVAAKSADEHRAILDAADDLVSPELIRRLVDAGLEIGGKGELPREEALARTTASLAAGIHDDDGRARALWLLGRADDMQDRSTAALEDFEAGRALAAAVGDPEIVARTLIGSGWVYVSLLDFDRTEALEREGLEIALRIGDHFAADNAYLALANRNQYRGEFTLALRNLQEAIEHAKKANDRIVVAAATANTGIVYDYMGNGTAAMDFLRRAIELYRARGNMRGVLRNLQNLASVESGYEHDDDAAKHLDEIEAIAGTLMDDRLRAFVSATRATIAQHRGDLKLAAAESQKALDLAKRADNRHLAIVSESTLSSIRYQQHRYREAAKLSDEVIAKGEAEASPPDVVWGARTLSARAHARMGDAASAERLLRGAIDLIEAQIGNVPGNEDAQQLFFADKYPPYIALFHLLAKQGRVAEGLDWVERVRSRSLSELLARGKVTLDAGLSADERNEELEQEKKIVALNGHLRDALTEEKRDEKKIRELRREIAEQRLVLAVLTDHLNTKHPEMALARGTLPRPKLADVQRLLPRDAAIIEYVVDEDATALVVIERQGKPRVFPIAIGAIGVETRVGQLIDSFAQRDLGYRREARRAYDLLLAPAAAALRGKKALWIVPDHSLWRLPFQALIDRNGHYVADKMSVFYAPSLSLLTWQAGHPRGKRAAESLLAVGNPQLSESTTHVARAIHRDASLGPLPDAETEARTIAAMYEPGADVEVGAEATETRFKHEAGRYRVLHLATHATFDNDDPMYSSLVLAQSASDDGLLEAREIARLKLAADLAILSSCESGRGKLSGEGVIGMSWALLVAGCPTAVVTQWDVASASTSALMIEFHRQLRKGHAPPEALRRAEITLMRDPHYAHPYYWAPFSVVGAAAR